MKPGKRKGSGQDWREARAASPGEGPGLPPLEIGDFAVAGGLALSVLLLYGATCCRTLYWGDSAEFGVICPLADIAHATGYPLFTILGHLFSWLPIGEPAFRVNLLAAVAGAVACGLAFLVARQTGVGPAGSAGGALLLAVSLELWEQSSAAEVYSLHVALTAGLLLASLRFHHAPSRGALVTAATLAGLSFANHGLTLWTLPAVLWLIGGRLLAWPRPGQWRPGPRDWKLASIGFAGAVALYLYLPIRSWTGPPFDHGKPGTPANLVAHVTGEQFRYRMFSGAAKGFAGEADDFWELLSGQLGFWALPLAAVGCLSLGIRAPKIAVAFALLAGADLAFTLNYHIPDKQGYYLPVYLVLALVSAEGAAGLAALFPRRAGRAGVALVLAAGVALSAGQRNLPEVDKSRDRSLPDLTRELLEPLPAGGLLLVDDVAFVWSTEYELLRGRSDSGVIVINDYLLCLPWYIDYLRRRYPALELPAEVDELVAERGEQVRRAEGWKVGDISQKYTERIARAIVMASLGHRKVFWNWHDFKERKEWLGFPLVLRGLTYEVFAPGTVPPTQEPWEFDYPDPERYRKPELRDRHAKHAAGSYSTACNRAGIALIGAGRHAEAREAFERSLAYDPGYAQVHLNLGVLYEQYLPDAALRDRHWKRFLELAPDDPQAAAVRKAVEASGR